MTDIEALIARLAAASEGDAALDVYLHLALCGRARQGEVPNYTTSLEVALALMPEGWSWKLVWEPEPGRYCAVVTHAERLGIVAPTIVCSKTTAPLAVCIVALKARSEIPRGTGDGE